MSNLIPIEYQNRRILTSKQLAEFYGVKPIKIQQNYSNNKSKYVAGKHYHLLKGQELSEFKNSLENFEVVEKKTPSLMLWTETGALLHAKSLGTKEAWGVYEMLIDTYFRHKDYLSNEFKIPTTLPDALRLAADLSEERDKLEKENQALLPQAQGYNLVVNGKGAAPMADFAQSMNWGRTRLFRFLREIGIIKPSPSRCPYGQYVTAGYFIVKSCDRYGVTYDYARVTPKGRDYIIKKAQQHGIIDELLLAGAKEALVC